MCMHAMCSEPLISPLINIFAYPQLMMATGRIGREEVVEAGRGIRVQTLQRRNQPRKSLSPAPRVRILLNPRRSRRVPRRTAWNPNDHVSQNQRLTLNLNLNASRLHQRESPNQNQRNLSGLPTRSEEAQKKKSLIRCLRPRVLSERCVSMMFERTPDSGLFECNV